LIRRLFHKELNASRKTTRGLSYYNADLKILQHLKQYERVILFNPYYLNKSETDMFKKIYDEGKLDIIIKGDKNMGALWGKFTKIFMFLRKWR
jgi:hypothetical protein